MSGENWQKVKSIYYRALTCPDPESYLASACPEDPTLLAEVRSLLGLEAELAERSFLQDHPFFPDQESLGPGDRVGAYLLRSLLGEGGMGRVYLAEQEEPVKRTVALKLLKPGYLSLCFMDYFQRERQVLALLEHRHIARIYDFGLHGEGPPFFAMEYVAGPTITAYCQRHRIPLAERLRLFLAVCDGFIHAHQKGFIHRDIKPANIIVGQENGQAIPKIIDFGLSKALTAEFGSHMMTHTNLVMGTPLYMSPEQAGMNRETVDVRTDIYALGMLLYELLAGRPPISETMLAGRTPEEKIFLVFGNAFAPPSATLRSVNGAHPEVRRIRGDLDAIAMKALAREPDARYPAVTSLKDDLQRFLSQEPVAARRHTSYYTLKKFVKRHQGPMLALALFWIGIAAGVFGLTKGYWQARESEAIASREVARGKQILVLLQDMLGTPRPLAMGRDVKMAEVVDAFAKRIEAMPALSPQVRATLAHTLGQSYFSLGNFPEGKKHATRALSLWHGLEPDAREDALKTELMLASAEADYGTFSEADRTLEALAQTAERQLGGRHRVVLEIGKQRAVMAERKGQYVLAEQRYREVLAAVPASRNPRDPLFLGARKGLAVALTKQGRSREAETLLQACLDGEIASYGDGHPQTTVTRKYLADLYTMDGRYAAACSLLEKALALTETHFGDRHPQTLTTEQSLADALLGNRQYQQAETRYRDVWRKWRETLGADHDYSLRAQAKLAHFYYFTHDFSSAEALLRPVLERTATDRPSVHDLNLTNLLGGILLYQGKGHEAVGLLRTNLEESLRILGSRHGTTAGTRLTLALALLYRGEPAEARTVAAPILDRESPYAVQPFVKGMIAVAEARYAEAVTFFQKALALEPEFEIMGHLWLAQLKLKDRDGATRTLLAMETLSAEVKLDQSWTLTYLDRVLTADPELRVHASQLARLRQRLSQYFLHK